MEQIPKTQACRFLLDRHGLLGAKRFRGENGLMDFMRMVGCVQYDPLDVCGRSHELALLARVKGFSRDMLSSLLYEKRLLMDYFDKNMCIMLTEDWPFLGFLREGFRQHTRSSEAVDPVIPDILKLVRQRGSLSARELDMPEKTDWSWNDTTLGRAALETLYFRGDLIIHHKTGAVKSYALARDHLPAALLDAPSPFQSDRERQMWQVLRRIGAVGLLWNAPSDAWLGVNGLTAQARGEVFAALEQAGVITPVQVLGITQPLYLCSEELARLRELSQPFTMDKSVRLLPPLDSLLWDRKLIAALFDFSYKWEVYTPEAQRRYGYYVLPVTCGERFCGRVEPICDRKSNALLIRRFWPEGDFSVTNRFLWALEDALSQLQAFLGLSRIIWLDGWLQE